MGMPRLRHVPILLVPAALNAVACAMSKAPAPAEPPSAADATQARSYGQQAGYAEDMRAQSPAATAAPVPPDEPPGERVRSCGLCAGPNSSGSGRRRRSHRRWHWT